MIGKRGHVARHSKLKETDMTEQLLTPEQPVRILKLLLATLARWRWEGSGPPCIKSGGRVRYADDDIQAFIAQAIRRRTSAHGHESRKPP